MSIHKSKGLEFPVVFLCGLSRDFNSESARAKVLCDKALGLGLSCVDTDNRVRYPSIAKRAIAAKIISEGISEEMRVLYVAMTRARDRLIMTYASRNLEGDLTSLVQRMDLSDPLLITANADCPGKWVLYAALKRKEASQFFAISGYPENTQPFSTLWKIQVVNTIQEASLQTLEEEEIIPSLPVGAVEHIKKNLSYQYPHSFATITPSKQTATQLKGRSKDAESAENTEKHHIVFHNLRKPSFIEQHIQGKDYGNAMHAAMEHICYEKCGSINAIEQEISRLVREEYISDLQANMVNVDQIAKFFSTQIGRRLQGNHNVLREFKFSVLDDGQRYCSGMIGEKVLLQGVVDCAIVEEDGITVLDFKTDRVTEETFINVAEGYRTQISVYADALSRIYQKPVKAAMLYFFQVGEFYEI